ncbi:DUF5412 family protein [Sporosarcina sp. ITBMC105]
MKYWFKVTAILVGIVVVIVITLFLILNYFIYQHEPKGELLNETVSPTGDYTVNMYVIRGNATVANSLRGEVIDHTNKDKKKTIYKANREEDADVEWLDDFIVSINGIQLDVRNDSYDWRKNK